MMIKCINTKAAPEAIGPYSQAVKAGDFLFMSGQISIDPETNQLELYGGDVAAQTDRILKNLQAILEVESLSLKNVVKTNVYLKDMDHFGKMNAVYAQHFGDHKPARACVAAKLPKDVDVGIEAVAVYS